LDDLVRRTAGETARFFRGEASDTRYGFELFRRAIVARDDVAWAALYALYEGMVCGWLARHPQFGLTGEEPENLVNMVFAKMWTAVDAAKFAHFADLAALLGYLKMCAHSVVVDHARRARRYADGQAAEWPGQGGWESQAERMTAWAPSPEDTVIDRLSADALWREVHAQLHDELEALVLYCSVVLDETPREIYTHHKERFASVQQVYSIKRNVMARLARHFERAHAAVVL
jgi:hypothetical protein